MQTASFLPDTGAKVSLNRSLNIPPSWCNCMKRKNVPQLWTDTKQQRPLDRLILSHLRLDELSTRIWFGKALHFAVEIVLGASFIYRFICGIFLVEHRVVPWPSQSVTILAHKQTLQDTHKSNTVSYNLKHAIDYNIDNHAAYNVAGAAKQILLQRNTQHHVLVTTKSYGLLTIHSRVMPRTVTVRLLHAKLWTSHRNNRFISLSVTFQIDRYAYQCARSFPKAKSF